MINEFSPELMCEASLIAKNRPEANSKYDQTYMKVECMLKQIYNIKNYIKNKKIVFVGDGDCTSLFILLMIKYQLIESPKSIYVIDFDERILNYILTTSNQYKVGLNVYTQKHNVIYPMIGDIRGCFDFFYINPPYGSQNKGLSIIAWIHRCMDLCNMMSQGCIIAPYDKEYPWTIDVMNNVQKFLLNNGFMILDLKSEAHTYHCKRSPGLYSSSMIVLRIDKKQSEYTNIQLPNSIIENLYGVPIDIPLYIKDINTEFGEEIF